MADTRSDLDPTRNRVLQALRSGPVTIEALSRTVGVTPNAVRAHLGTLERDGLVGRTGVVRSEHPGKPALLYGLTARGEDHFSAAYPPALAALIGALVDGMPSARVDEIFAAAGSRLASATAAVAQASAADCARQLLESLGATVAVHAAASGRAVVAGAACPLRTAVRACPQTCEMVRAMLAHSTGAPVAMQCEHGDAPRCRFEVG
jgi:predicted ArsR family transcriptional regulator